MASSPKRLRKACGHFETKLDVHNCCHRCRMCSPLSRPCDFLMERSIIQKFQRLQVLPNFDFQTMDELVQDLTNALEESSRCSAAHKIRKRRGMKRRSKAVTNIPLEVHISEESESSFDEAHNSKEPFDSVQQTDSDDVSPAGCLSVLNYLRWQTPHIAGSFAESDSVNENFSPVRPHRRKRKFKRMAVDPSPLLSAEHMKKPVSMEKRNKSLKILKHRTDIENMYRHFQIDPLGLMCGKRKRSMRERSVEFVDNESSLMNSHCHPALLNMGSASADEHYLFELRHRREEPEFHMDCSDEGRLACKHVGESSSSSLSSSESDAGVYTNDEGREGDDEQSDFYHEPGPACGVPGVLPWWEKEPIGSSNTEELDPKFHAILTGSFQHMSWEAQEAFREQIRKLEVPGREIRAGRRRLHDLRPGFSIVTSFNEKISRFLQDPDQNELRLHPVKKKERAQLNYLASLYSLNMRIEGTRKKKYPVLTKTANTTQAVCVERFNFPAVHASVSDIKRRRKTPPSSPVSESVVGEKAGPIGENNVGNIMLRNMGWEPGTSLGLDNSGLQIPIKAVIRPRRIGLGYNSNSNSS